MENSFMHKGCAVSMNALTSSSPWRG